MFNIGTDASDNPADVRAGDIAVTGDIEVLNKDLLICHLDHPVAP